MKRGHFIFEAALMAISVIVFLVSMLMVRQITLYFLAWQAILGFLQFSHALFLTLKYKKSDSEIWRALRIYWTIAAVSLAGVACRSESWFPPPLVALVLFVLPWFNAIYLTMFTYRNTNKTVPIT